jgi:tRNA A37 threonylcarbamoyladenosine dehydratase
MSDHNRQIDCEERKCAQSRIEDLERRLNGVAAENKRLRAKNREQKAQFSAEELSVIYMAVDYCLDISDDIEEFEDSKAIEAARSIKLKLAGWQRSNANRQ